MAGEYTMFLDNIIFKINIENKYFFTHYQTFKTRSNFSVKVQREIIQLNS